MHEKLNVVNLIYNWDNNEGVKEADIHTQWVTKWHPLNYKSPMNTWIKFDDLQKLAYLHIVCLKLLAFINSPELLKQFLKKKK